MADYPEYMTRKIASAFLRTLHCFLSEQTLKNLAAKNSRYDGPPFYRDGGRILYKKDELEDWRKKRLRKAQ